MAAVMWGLLVLVLVGAAIALVVRTAAVLESRAARQRNEQLERQLQGACKEAVTIVDLTTMEKDVVGEISTPSITTIVGRIETLDTRLSRLVRQADDARLAEALAEMRHVALSLEAALDCERTLRVQGGKGIEAQRSASHERIARRSAELDLAARSVTWLATDSDRRSGGPSR